MAENILNESEYGGISVETSHIFPIIKRWLYSEKDIFLREIVSNAADAITKIKRLTSLGEANCTDDFKIVVRVDKAAGTLSVEDNGIGMSADDLRRYICQIALSGALEFIEKYESTSSNTDGNGIIGHFGLGFYSAFMVADKVEIITKSYDGINAVHWVCTGDGNYEISSSDKEDRGTEVIMHITDDETDYLNVSKIREMLDKYCAFMPYEIYLESSDESENTSAEPVNITAPLWQKRPSECSDQDYNDFYHKVFHDFNDPLFCIHINADYPLNFKGILYFPKLKSEYDQLEGQIKLFYNQVFVADNVKEIIPDYLVMLKGVIDCPELPLNVSRSYLQNNTYVSKVSAHIVKKIADKICNLCANQREKYNQIWGDIRTFVEYASIRDRKFFERVKDSVLLKLTDGDCVTITEYINSSNDSTNESSNPQTIYYTTDPIQQSQYVAMYAAQGLKVAVLDQFIDTQFISSAESIYPNIRFTRVDSDVSALTKSQSVQKNEDIIALFRQVTGNEKLEVEFEHFNNSNAPALLTVNEAKRRMDDFMKAYSYMTGSEAPNMPLSEQILILNTASPLYSRLENIVASGEKDRANFAAGYIYKLSLMAHRRFEADELQSFLNDSYKLLENY